MGIDIYARYTGHMPQSVQPLQTEPVKHSSTPHLCHVREAYHGEPYVTKFLFWEAFRTGKAEIPASILRKRLPEALQIAEQRERKLYPKHSAKTLQSMLKAYETFVDHCEQIEATTGHPPIITADY